MFYNNSPVPADFPAGFKFPRTLEELFASPKGVLDYFAGKGRPIVESNECQHGAIDWDRMEAAMYMAGDGDPRCRRTPGCLLVAGHHRYPLQVVDKVPCRIVPLGDAAFIATGLPREPHG